MTAAELLAWAQRPHPHDDRTWAGLNVTLADVKRGVLAMHEQARLQLFERYREEALHMSSEWAEKHGIDYDTEVAADVRRVAVLAAERLALASLGGITLRAEDMPQSEEEARQFVTFAPEDKP